MQKELSNIFTPIERSSLDCQKSFALVWFRITTPSDWLNKLAPLCHPIRGTNETNRDSIALVFSRFASATCICFEIWLVCWIVYVICDRPEVLVSRHSIETTLILKKKMNVINTHSHMGLIILSWPITSLFLDAAHFYSLIQFSSPLLITCQHITRVKKQ